MRLATLFALLRQYWRPVVAVHLIFTLLGIAVLSPLFGMLLQGVINLSGNAAVVGQDIAHVLLSPIGMLAGVLLLAVLVAIAGLELGTPAVECRDDLRQTGSHQALPGQFALSLRRATDI